MPILAVDEPDNRQMAGKFYRLKYEILRSLQEAPEFNSLPLPQVFPSKRLPLPFGLLATIEEDHFQRTDDGQPKTK